MWKRFVIASVILFLITGCSVDLAPSSVTDFFSGWVVNGLLLLVGLVVLSLFAEVAQKNTVIGVIWLVGVIGLFLTGIFYWRMGNQMIGQPQREIFVMAFDIGFAHAIVSLSVLIFLGNMFSLGIWITSWVVGFPLMLLIKLITKPDSSKLPNMTAGCLGNLFVIITFAGIPYFYYLLMIGSTDLQTYLFGSYDGNLGLYYPTTFRFPILMEQLQLQWIALKNDPILGTYILSFGVLFAAASKIVGLYDLAKKIRDLFKRNTPTDQTQYPHQ